MSNDATLYNHAFDFAFEVGNCIHEEGKKVSGATLRQHLIERVNRLSDDELEDCCGCFDTMEEEECI